MRDNIIELITESMNIDEQGQPIKSYKRRTVFAGKKSISQKEFFTSRTQSPYTDIRNALCFEIDLLEYEVEQLLEYEGVTYKIYRLYEKYGILEIYCKQRGGVSGNKH